MKQKKLNLLFLKFYQEYPNAGDQFSFVLARHYFSSSIISSTKKSINTPNLILVGSYLNKSDEHSHICGAGFIATDPSKSKLAIAPKAIHCVRGPLTAELLENQGIPCPEVYADPGILAPNLYPRKTLPRTKIGIIPHFLDANLPWIDRCRGEGISIIDVLSPLEKYFEDLHRCEIILSSSLHGLIFAHACGIPALWIELSDNVFGDGFKFYDYYLSLGRKPDEVRRVRVTEDINPNDIAKLATLEDQSRLMQPLKEAMSNTIKQLRLDQRKACVKNIFIPLISHKYKKGIKTLKTFKPRKTWLLKQLKI